MTNILTHYDADGIFSAAILQLIKDRKIDSSKAFGTSEFGESLNWITLKTIEPDYVCDLGNAFADDERIDSDITVIDHHPKSCENARCNTILRQDGNVTLIIYHEFLDTIKKLPDKLNRYVRLFTLMGARADLSTESSLYLQYSEDLLKDNEFTVDTNFNLSYKINNLKRVLYEDSVKLGIRALKEIVENDNPMIFRELDYASYRKKSKYPACFFAQKVNNTYYSQKENADEFIVKRVKWSGFEHPVTIVFFEHSYDLYSAYYKYKPNGGILVSINLQDGKCHARSDEAEEFSVNKMFENMETIVGSGHKMAAGGQLQTYKMHEILNELKEVIEKMEEGYYS